MNKKEKIYVGYYVDNTGKEIPLVIFENEKIIKNYLIDNRLLDEKTITIKSFNSNRFDPYIELDLSIYENIDPSELYLTDISGIPITQIEYDLVLNDFKEYTNRLLNIRLDLINFIKLVLYSNKLTKKYSADILLPKIVQIMSDLLLKKEDKLFKYYLLEHSITRCNYDSYINQICNYINMRESRKKIKELK